MKRGSACCNTHSATCCSQCNQQQDQRPGNAGRGLCNSHHGGFTALCVEMYPCLQCGMYSGLQQQMLGVRPAAHRRSNRCLKEERVRCHSYDKQFVCRPIAQGRTCGHVVFWLHACILTALRCCGCSAACVWPAAIFSRMHKRTTVAVLSQGSCRCHLRHETLQAHHALLHAEELHSSFQD